MIQLRTLEPYSDDQGNEIVYEGPVIDKMIDIRFKGKNNRLVISAKAGIKDLLITFTGNGGLIEIDETTKPRAGLRFELRCGHDSHITIGSNVGCAGRAFVSAVEGVSVSIGADVMFAKNVEVRGDDTHPIFDVASRRRTNPSRPIVIGEHVWLAKHVVVMGGVTVGNGSVIGFRSIVTSSIPNNVVAVGAPARVVRRDIAWERPEVVHRLPGEEYPREGERSSAYWNLTVEPESRFRGGYQREGEKPGAAGNPTVEPGSAAGSVLDELTVGCSSLSKRANSFVSPRSPRVKVILAVQGPTDKLVQPSNVRIVPVAGKGVAKSRNAVIDATKTRYLLFTDDDVTVDLDGVGRAIERLRDSGAAIALGVGVDPTGGARKQPPSTVKNLTLYNSARAATYEMLIDVDQVRAAGVRFDERFGAGMTYYLGDEYIFIADLLRSGRRGLLVPDVFGAHPVESSGSRWATRSDNHARALVFNRVFGVRALPVRAAFALRRHKQFRSWKSMVRFVLDFSRPKS